MDNQIYQEILKLYEKYLLKPASEFSVQDYNNFEQEMWSLKEKFSYESSPFLLLPDPAKPELYDKQKYLDMMQESYQKLKNKLA